MASTTVRKETAGFTGNLCLLLLGLLLPSVLVSGQSTTTAAPMSTTTANPTTAITTSTSTTQTTTSGGAGSTTSTPVPTTSSSPTTTQSSTSGPSATSTTLQSSSVTSSSTAASTSTAAPGTATSTTSGAMNPSSQSQSMTTSNSMTSMMPNISSSNSTSGANGTTMSNSTYMSMIYCPSFTCNYSDCYTMYTSQNATSCPDGVCWCQLMRPMDMCYTVGCAAYCADPCVNASQTNCSVNCCNSTGCLNASFASMMMTTTVMPTTTTTTTTPMTTTSPQTTVDNGKKCHAGSCTGNVCYTGFKSAALQTCSSSQPHCQLKKETVNSNVQWTAGCTTNCSGQTACKTSTTPPCHLECCNATMTSSCLWLNGTLNVPNFTTRGPQLHTELIASLTCLLALTVLL